MYVTSTVPTVHGSSWDSAELTSALITGSEHVSPSKVVYWTVTEVSLLAMHDAPNTQPSEQNAIVCTGYSTSARYRKRATLGIGSCGQQQSNSTAVALKFVPQNFLFGRD